MKILVIYIMIGLIGYVYIRLSALTRLDDFLDDSKEFLSLIFSDSSPVSTRLAVAVEIAGLFSGILLWPLVVLIIALWLLDAHDYNKES